MARVKNLSKGWDQKFRRRKQEDLKWTESQIKELYENNREGFLSLRELEELKELEGRKYALLFQEEAKWRLKSRAFWLVEGDQNTNFFHKHAEMRKNYKTIQEIQTHDQVIQDFDKIKL